MRSRVDINLRGLWSSCYITRNLINLDSTRVAYTCSKRDANEYGQVKETSEYITYLVDGRFFRFYVERTL